MRLTVGENLQPERSLTPYCDDGFIVPGFVRTHPQLPRNTMKKVN